MIDCPVIAAILLVVPREILIVGYKLIQQVKFISRGGKIVTFKKS